MELDPRTAGLELIFSINDERDWDRTKRRTLPELKAALMGAFAQLASSTAEYPDASSS
jgi:hypothetical protein